jgi:hypothetical protein
VEVIKKINLFLTNTSGVKDTFKLKTIYTHILKEKKKRKKREEWIYY